ncbi:MAG: sigma 54-interacting transcriptional regulator [Clostridia bacterium]|nr:sigma 54-interacting transcriptional regulator [Clostridia bacterium]
MKLTIKDIMTANPISLNLHDSIQKAAEIMISYRIDGIPVIDDRERLVGILTKTHIFKALGMDVNTPICELMQTNMVTISENAVPEDAWQTPVGRLPVINEKGEMVGIVTRTDLVKAFRQQLEYALEEVNTIINSTHNSIVAINSDSEIRLMNKSAEDLVGISLQESIGRPIEEIIPNSCLTSVIQTGECYYLKKITVGQTEVLANETPIISNGKIIGAVATFQRISEVEKISHELRTVQDANSELNAVIDFSVDGIVVADNKGIILKNNTASRELLGIKEENMVGLSVQWLIEKGFSSESVILRVIEKKSPVSRVQRLKTGREILHTGTPIFDENGDVYRVVANMRDLTELNYLREQFREAHNLSVKYFSELEQYRKEQLHEEIVFQSEVMTETIEKVIKVAKYDSTVLLLGESGVGKEQLAKIIHEASERAKNPFIKLNCASIPPHLVESELFGYEGGAFTGANKEGRPGLFEIAESGTLFLDEIGELPLEIQSKLLRVLQEREIYRVGGRKPIKLNVRILAATNSDLEKMIKENTFRQDLYYRLNVISIVIPPLRERKEDIPALIYHFLQKCNQKHKTNKKIAPKLVEKLINHQWPGNIRELENTIERMVVLTDKDLLDGDFFPGKGNKEENGWTTRNLRTVLEESEKRLILQVYKEFKSTRKAAKILGIDQSTVVKKLQKYTASDDDNHK